MPPVAVALVESLRDVVQFVPVPALGACCATFAAVVAICHELRSQKRQAMELCELCRKILAAINAKVSAMPGLNARALPADSSLAANIHKLEGDLEVIRIDLKAILGLKFLQRLLKKEKNADILSSHMTGLRWTVEIFQIESNIDISASLELDRQARQQDSDHFEELLETIISNDQRLEDSLQLNFENTQSRLAEIHNMLLFAMRQKTECPPGRERRFYELTHSKLVSMSGGLVPSTPSQPWVISSLDVEIFEVIGRGANSTVYRGKWNNEEVAVKKLLDGISDVTFMKEADMWANLSNHLRIHRFLRACLTPKLIISAYHRHGDVAKYLKSHPDADRVALIRDIAVGMDFLHANKKLHCDLKASNVLVDEGGKACISDFGLSEVRKESETITRGHRDEHVTGTMRWMSPERLKQGEPTMKVDVYAFAMTCYEIFSGGIPFATFGNPDVYSFVVDQNIRPPRPQSSVLSDQVWDLITQCWDRDPALRPPFSTIVSRLEVIIARPPPRTSSSTVQSSPAGNPLQRHYTTESSPITTTMTTASPTSSTDGWSPQTKPPSFGVLTPTTSVGSFETGSRSQGATSVPKSRWQDDIIYRNPGNAPQAYPQNPPAQVATPLSSAYHTSAARPESSSQVPPFNDTLVGIRKTSAQAQDTLLLQDHSREIDVPGTGVPPRDYLLPSATARGPYILGSHTPSTIQSSPGITGDNPYNIVTTPQSTNIQAQPTNTQTQNSQPFDFESLQQTHRNTREVHSPHYGWSDAPSMPVATPPPTVVDQASHRTSRTVYSTTATDLNPRPVSSQRIDSQGTPASHPNEFRHHHDVSTQQEPPKHQPFTDLPSQTVYAESDLRVLSHPPTPRLVQSPLRQEAPLPLRTSISSTSRPTAEHADSELVPHSNSVSAQFDQRPRATAPLDYSALKNTNVELPVERSTESAHSSKANPMTQPDYTRDAELSTQQSERVSSNWPKPHEDSITTQSSDSSLDAEEKTVIESLKARKLADNGEWRGDYSTLVNYLRHTSKRIRDACLILIADMVDRSETHKPSNVIESLLTASILSALEPEECHVTINDATTQYWCQIVDGIAQDSAGCQSILQAKALMDFIWICTSHDGRQSQDGWEILLRLSQSPSIPNKLFEKALIRMNEPSFELTKLHVEFLSNCANSCEERRLPGHFKNGLVETFVRAIELSRAASTTDSVDDVHGANTRRLLAITALRNISTKFPLSCDAMVLTQGFRALPTVLRDDLAMRQRQPVIELLKNVIRCTREEGEAFEALVDPDRGISSILVSSIRPTENARVALSAWETLSALLEKLALYHNQRSWGLRQQIGKNKGLQERLRDALSSPTVEVSRAACNITAGLVSVPEGAAKEQAARALHDVAAMMIENGLCAQLIELLKDTNPELQPAAMKAVTKIGLCLGSTKDERKGVLDLLLPLKRQLREGKDSEVNAAATAMFAELDPPGKSTFFSKGIFRNP